MKRQPESSQDTCLFDLPPNVTQAMSGVHMFGNVAFITSAVAIKFQGSSQCQFSFLHRMSSELTKGKQDNYVHYVNDIDTVV